MIGVKTRAGSSLRQFTIGAVTIGLGLFTWSGCDSNRVNHLHNPDNLAKATEAATTFDAVTSSRTGLPAKMLANVAAEKNLRTAVAATSNELLDLASIQMVNDLTWSSLRQELAGEFGLHDQTDLPMLVFALVNAKRVTNQASRETLKRDATAIALLAAKTRSHPNLRNDLVSAPVDGLLGRYPEIQSTSSRELAKANLPLNDLKDFLVPVTADDVATAVGLSLEEIGFRLDSSSTDPVGLTRSTLSTSFPVQPADMAPEIARATTEIQEVKVSEQTHKRLKLLARVIRTYEALVKGERARVAIYKKAGEDLLKKSQKDFGLADIPAPTADPSAQSALDLIFELRAAVNEHWNRTDVRQNYLAQGNELQRLLLSSAAASKDPASVYSLVPLVGEGLTADDLSWLETYVDALSDTLAKMEATETKTKVLSPKDPTHPTNVFLAALEQLRKDLAEDPSDVDLSRMLAAAVEAADALSLDLDILKTKAEETAKELTPVVQALVQSAAAGKLTDENAKTLIRFVIGPQRGGDLDKAFNDAVSAEAVKAMKALLTDIAKEDASAGKRVADYVIALQRLHMELHEENVRHYLSLSVIAKAEVARWETLGDLTQSFENLYDPSRGVLGRTIPSGAERCPVTITSDSKVVASLRLLAERANMHQTGSPLSTDPSGATTEMWASSLANAIETIQTYQLIATVNRRWAADNNIALISELSEHSIHLDHLLTAGVEEEIRLALADQQAFHASGITDKDLELLVGIVQSGLLGWIGAEQ